MRTRFPKRRLAAIVLLLACLAIPFSWAFERPVIGRLTDGSGAAIANALIYVTAISGPEKPIYDAGLPAPTPSNGAVRGAPQTAVLTSDLEGAFYARLPAGRYRVAVMKSGYDVAMTEIHTLARGFLTLQMVQTSTIHLGDLPVGSAGKNLGTDWILRQQRGDVLRAQRPIVDDSAGVMPAVTADQRLPGVSGAAYFAGGDPASGRTTGLTLDGTIGEDGLWRFGGWRGRSYADVDGDGGRLEDRGDRLSAGIDYRPGGRDHLTGEVSYGSRDFSVEPEDVAIGGTRQQQRSLGLQSRWERALSDTASFDLSGRYDESSVRLPGHGDEAQVADQSWFAAARFAVEEGDHRIDLGLRTGGYRYDMWDEGILLHGLPELPGFGMSGERGRTISLLAADQWQAGARARLDYGFGYHSQDTVDSFIVPRVGMTVGPAQDGSFTLCSALLYRLNDHDTSSADRLGYLIGIERRPPHRLQLAARLSYRPFVEGHGVREPSRELEVFDDPPLFLSDGAAANHELELEMTREFGGLRGQLAGRLGRAEGRVTPAVDEAPVQILSTGEVRYYQTRVSASYAPTDTEVQVDFRRVTAGEAAGGTAADPLGYRQIDLMVLQDIPGPRLLRNARLRLLMAYRGLDYDSLFDRPGGAATPGSASRVTGGLDIRF